VSILVLLWLSGLDRRNFFSRIAENALDASNAFMLCTDQMIANFLLLFIQLFQPKVILGMR
jgi:hypothetical protein